MERTPALSSRQLFALVESVGQDRAFEVLQAGMDNVQAQILFGQLGFDGEAGE